jgi:mannose/fructose/N-acetylgalactosamine-specific phosphotransferase system component IIB
VSIALARVDDRLIHGQVVEGWVPHVEADVIVIVSDKICLDQGRCRLLTLVVPDYLDLKVVPLQSLGRLLEDLDTSKILLLFEDLNDVFGVMEKGVSLNRINLGNLHHVRGGVEVTPSVYLNRKDIEMIHNLADRGVAVEALDVPDGKSLNVLDFLSGIKGLL